MAILIDRAMTRYGYKLSELMEADALVLGLPDAGR